MHLQKFYGASESCGMMAWHTVGTKILAAQRMNGGEKSLSQYSLPSESQASHKAKLIATLFPFCYFSIE